MTAANKNVILIVALGAIACLFSIFLSQFFAKRIYDNETLLARIERLPPAVEHLQVLSKSFVQSGDPMTWKRITEGLEVLKADLRPTPDVTMQWRAEMDALGTDLESYARILNQIQDPAILLNREKDRLKNISLSFSQEVEKQIVQPYRQQEGKRIYEGEQLDPFKVRIKDTAMEVIRLHLAQQLILLELLVDWDLVRYQDKKAIIEADLAQHQKRLNYLNILLGNEPTIDAIIASLVRKLDDLILQEQTIFRHFTTIISLNDQLAHLNSRLLVASKAFTGKLRTEIIESNRINQILGWSLPTILLAALGILGTLLARSIIQFVKDLESNRQELQINESNLKVTLDSIGDAVIATDRQGRITRMNPSAELLTGSKLASASGRKLSEVFHIINARTRARVVDPAEKVMASGKVVGLANHTVLLANDGKEYQIADSGAPIRTPDGRIIGVVLVFRDVTESYVQEQKLRESETKYRRLHESMRDAFVSVDMTGNLQEFNPAYQTMLGYSEEDLRQLTYQDLTPDQWHAFEAEIVEKQVLERGYSDVYEKEYRRKDGTVFPVELRVFLMRDADYQPTGMWAIVRDITERKQAEELLKASTERLQLALQAALMGTWEWDIMGDSIVWSPETRNIFGIDAGEFGETYQAYLGFAVPEIREEVDDRVKKFLNSARASAVIQYEHEIIRDDGKRSWIEVRGTLFLNKRNQPARMTGICADITERKRVEAELERHREHLEELVAERTAELRQAMNQLVQSEKLAALGHLVAGVTHELNTPLGNARVIAGSLGEALGEFAAAAESGTLRRSQLDAFLARGHEAVAILERNAARAADLIGHFKQVAVDQTSTRRRRFNLRQTVEELLATLRPQFKRTAHRVELDIPSDIDLDSYPGPLEQVLANLVSNSLTHGFAGIEAGTIRVGAAPLDADHVQLDYADDGAGIPETILNRIFEPFFTTRLGQGGSGLGLYIVYNLVTGVLGGTVRVDSSPGAGVAFAITVPRIAPDHAGPETPSGHQGNRGYCQVVEPRAL